MVFSFFKTDAEIKRDRYYKLYQLLNNAISKHDKKVAEANTAYKSYIGTVPMFSKSSIPSNDFEPKRLELNHKLSKLFERDKEQRLRLMIARDRAYSRYTYYKNLAISEANKK